MSQTHGSGGQPRLAVGSALFGSGVQIDEEHVRLVSELNQSHDGIYMVAGAAYVGFTVALV